ncbi:MAG: hypothetical protein V1792_28915 [Pseudomonadota bacterium]
MHIADIPLIFLVATAIPILVERSLDRQTFSTNLRHKIILGGWIWLAYAVCHEMISGTLFGIWTTDEIVHNMRAGDVMKLIDEGKWDQVWAFAEPGTNAWQLYLALLYSFTGVSNTGSTIINMFFAFWGGLILVREFVKILPSIPPRTWPLVVVFFPSVIYWCTWNLKEGFMYWAVCLVISGVGVKKPTLGDILRVGTGVMVGGLLRPHIIIGWFLAVIGVNLLRRGRAPLALLSMIVLPLAVTAISSVAKIETPSVENALDRAYGQAKILSERSGGSTIHYEEGRPILFVSGFASLFFRPYPWRVRHLGLLLSCLETWSMTLLMLWVWLSMPPRKWGHFFKMPHVKLALLACVYFSLFFTFLANEGLLARQRVQAVPALLILSMIPILYIRAAKTVEKGLRMRSALRSAAHRNSTR